MTTPNAQSLEGLIERVKAAIDDVQLFSRFNDWASDRVDGCPIEICRHTDGGDIVVVARFGGEITEREALYDTVSTERAKAAIHALSGNTIDWEAELQTLSQQYENAADDCSGVDRIAFRERATGVKAAISRLTSMQEQNNER